MHLKRPIASLAALALLIAPAAATAQIRTRVGSWLVVCQRDAAGYCSANAKVTGGRGGARGYAFQLHVWRAHAGDVLQVTFLAGVAKPGASESLEWRVDALPPITFEAGTGYRSIRSSSSYALSSGDPVAALLTQMLSGKHLQVAYRDAQGRPVAAAFSLDGFRQAVTRFEGAAVDQMLAAKAASGPTAPELTHQRQPASEQAQPSTAAAMPEPVLGSEPAPSRAHKARKEKESVHQFACRGNDPAWSLAIDQQRATLRLPDSEPATRELMGKFSMSGEGRTSIMTWRGKAPGEHGELIAFIVEQSCREGTSDTEGQAAFAFQTQVTLPDGRKTRGCCNAGMATTQALTLPPGLESARIANFAAKSSEDWARPLLMLMPAINACLARTPGPSPYVTKAWQLNPTMAGVRTRGGDGSWFGCIASLDGSVVDRFEMLPRNDLPLPGENLTLFTPAGGTPRSGNCWEHERVLDAAGTLLGYLSYNTC
jgi:invasion protein IalB/uncharacterized membrane protein